ncbi:carboxymuconolactone decarboxylase family protein [Defluviimonas sp. D31]|uniref:carboxymuconolactone decarboxylase family protein n=1 Tax=Defluviimonas sp. D31 TaxID=3083253 RepID=UPI00296EC580|nr:carboxymuconolactone decarboxylase family protein [Defluviimonas sp. D31]MDW4551041.1 carboxymuconolactone decarboxylase family protein [Defluviimonas sp. D31]
MPALKSLCLSLSISAVAVALPASLRAEDAAKTARDEIAAAFGTVPTFIGQVPDAALPGLWTELKMLEMSDETALDTKTKALISLAVASQIPCDYCIWMDTNTARQAGATDQEIGEAVALAGMTRNWSTIFNGLQVDFDTFKKELGGS